MAEERSEIAFFDVETTIPLKAGQGFTILEFGAILVCPKKLVELDSYSTLIRPNDLSLFPPKYERSNGNSTASASTAPPFFVVADKIFHILNGRIWAGHNILRFDCPRIREAFAEIGRSPPEPKGIIDSLALLTERFGRRAGNMKMATLASYFGLGQQTHRSLDDVRMNLEVLKYCATVLFLESSLPDILASDSCVLPTSTARRTRSGGSVSSLEMSYTPTSDPRPESHLNKSTGLHILIESSRSKAGSFDMRSLSKEKMHDAIQVDDASVERHVTEPTEISCPSTISEGSHRSSLEMSYTPTSGPRPESHSNQSMGLHILIESSRSEARSFHMRSLSKEIRHDAIQVNDASMERPVTEPTENPCPLTISKGSSSSSLEMSYTPSLDLRPENHLNQSVGPYILIESSRSEAGSFDMRSLSKEIMKDAIQVNDASVERPVTEPTEIPCPSTISKGSSSLSGFMTSDDVSIPLISASMVNFYRGCRRIQILHDTVVLKLHCTHLKVRFGINQKFVDQAGRPRLSFVVDAPPSVCQVLDACDIHAQRLFVETGSTSDWRPVVTRKNGYWNFPNMRLHIPTVFSGEVAKYGTEIFQRKNASGAEQKLVFSKFDAAELESLFTAGTLVDVFFSLDPYDYKQNAGIRLVSDKLVIHS